MDSNEKECFDKMYRAIIKILRLESRDAAQQIVFNDEQIDLFKCFGIFNAPPNKSIQADAKPQSLVKDMPFTINPGTKHELTINKQKSEREDSGCRYCIGLMPTDNHLCNCPYCGRNLV